MLWKKWKYLESNSSYCLLSGKLFDYLKSDTAKFEQILYFWRFLRPSYTLQMQHIRSRIMICSCRFQRNFLVQYFRRQMYGKNSSDHNGTLPYSVQCKILLKFAKKVSFIIKMIIINECDNLILIKISTMLPLQIKLYFSISMSS